MRERVGSRGVPYGIGSDAGGRFLVLVGSCVMLACASGPVSRAGQVHVCVDNDTFYYVTLNVRDGNSGSLIQPLYVGGLSSALRRVTIPADRVPIRITVKAFGVPGEHVPPAFDRLVVRSGEELRLVIREGGANRFAQSSLGMGCNERERSRI